MESNRDPSWRLGGFARVMRHEPTDAEKRIWSRLRDRRLGGFKFRRQVPIGGFIVDVYCMECELAVELDGGQHLEPSAATYDQRREQALASVGIRTIRFSDVDVLKNTDAVLNAILCELQQNPHPDPLPEYRARG
jgi:very-short-patch-repair endonuclease